MSKYRLSIKNTTDQIYDLEKLETKIDVIKNIDNEYCQNIVSIYNNYKIYIENSADVNYFSKHKSVILTSEFISTVDIIKTIDLKNKVMILCFESNNSENVSQNKIDMYNKLLEQNSKNILVIVGNYNKETKTKLEGIHSRLRVISMSIIKINKILLNEKPDNIFMHINADTLENNISWENNIKNNLENLLFDFNNVSLREVKDNPIEVSLKCMQPRTKKYQYSISNKHFILEDLIKFLISVKSICNKNNICFGLNYKNNIVVANVVHSDLNNLKLDNKKTINELINLIDIMMCKNKKEIYERVYVTLCDYLDNDCQKYNYCNFENGKCIAQRDTSNKTEYPINKCNGCCYDIDKLIECNKLQDGGCTIKSISCKLFICKYLRDRGINYPTNKNLYIKCFLNYWQRPILVWNFFKPQSEIISKLLKIKK